MPKNVIVNGDFELGSVGWSGENIETGYQQNVYLGDGETDRVAEIDGTKNTQTYMEQSFEVLNSPLNTTLTFESALRMGSDPQQEGFLVEILDSSGGVVLSQSIQPQDQTMQEYSLDVNFPSAGTYTLRFTEQGLNDGAGGIIDNVALMICFEGNARIQTETGERAATEIQAGDMVMTQNGYKPVRWVGRRKITAEKLAADEKLRPVLIKAGTLGRDLPKRDLKVSRQHRMFVNSALNSDVLGHSSALIAAVKLTGLEGIEVDNSLQEIEYVHFLFDNHEVIYAEGAPSESLHLGENAQLAVGEEAFKELELIFGDELLNLIHQKPAAFVPNNQKQRQLVNKIAKRPFVTCVQDHGF